MQLNNVHRLHEGFYVDADCGVIRHARLRYTAPLEAVTFSGTTITINFKGLQPRLKNSRDATKKG